MANQEEATSINSQSAMKMIRVVETPQIDCIKVSDIKEAINDSRKARKMLLRKLRSPSPCNTMVKSGIVARCVSYLSRKDIPALQFEAAYVSNILASKSPDQIESVMVTAGVVPHLVTLVSSHNVHLAKHALHTLQNSQPDQTSMKTDIVPNLLTLMRSTHPHVARLAVRALGNIACESPQHNEIVVKKGAVTHLASLIMSSSHLKVVDQAARTLSRITHRAGPNVTVNIAKVLKLINPGNAYEALRSIIRPAIMHCLYKNPSPSIKVLRHIVPTLCELLSSCDMEVVACACRALLYITDAKHGLVQKVVDSGAVHLLVQVLELDDETSAVVPILTSVSHLMKCNCSHMEAVLKCGVLHIIRNLLDYPEDIIIKEVAMAIANTVKDGSTDQIRAVISADLLYPLTKFIAKYKENFRIEVFNCSYGRTEDQVLYIFQHYIVQAFCDHLRSKDCERVTVSLDGIASILKGAAKVGRVEEVAQVIRICRGLHRMMGIVKFHKEQCEYKVCWKAGDIIQLYFSSSLSATGKISEAEDLLECCSDHHPSWPPCHLQTHDELASLLRDVLPSSHRRRLKQEIIMTF